MWIHNGMNEWRILQQNICVYKVMTWIISIVLTCNSEEHSPTRDWPSRVCSTTHILSSIQAIYWCRKEKGTITQNVAIRHITDCLSIHCPRYYGWRDTQNLTLHYCWEMFRHNHVCWVDTKMRLIQRSCQLKGKTQIYVLNIVLKKSQNF